MLDEIIQKVVILIPSYNRPEAIQIYLPYWLKAKIVSRVIVLAEASSFVVAKRYSSILKNYKNDKLIYTVSSNRKGSIFCRNALLRMAAELNSGFPVMADDDFLLFDEDCLNFMVRDLESDQKIGAVGGHVIVRNAPRADPDFFLNLPINLADAITKITGYVFLDTVHGPRYAEALPHFFVLRNELLGKVLYDECYGSPTNFREESDLQKQITHAGYKLLYEPRAKILHEGFRWGGCRSEMKMSERMYWKACNNTFFTLKWNSSVLKRLWFLMVSSLVMVSYRPWCALSVFKGLKKAIKTYPHVYKLSK